MSNKKINELPLYTGDTTGAYFIMNNSSETNTYKVTKETILGPSKLSGSNLQFGYFSGSNYVSGSDLLHLTNSGFTVSVGTSNVFSFFPERFIVDAEGSYNIATFQTTQPDSYAEVNIKNYGIGTNASADLVLWNNVATESSSFVDLGINSSNYNGGEVGYGGDGYLFNQSNDIYIGSTGEGNHGHTHIFGGNLWQSSSISVYQDGTIGFNTDKYNNTSNTIPTSGFTYEFSGSVKLDNDLLVDGTISTINYTLPLTDGTSTQVITSNGLGNLYWSDGGTSGTSGTSGINGSSGTSGINGTSGTSGSSGYSGSNGTSGTSGISGSNGTSGTSGNNGTSGTSGTGTNGTSGSSGTSGVGTSGTSGTSGAVGSTGTSGTSGTSGYVDNDWLYFKPTTTTIPSTGNNFVLTGTTTSNGSVSYNQSTGIITLAANKTYKLDASFALSNNVNNTESQYQWINVTASNTTIGNTGGLLVVNSTAPAAWQPLAEAIIVTTGTTQVALRSIFSNSTGGFTTGLCFMTVTQINGWSGSSGTSGSNGSSGTSGSNGSSGTSVLTTVTGTTSTGDLNVGGNHTVTGSTTLRGSLNVGVGSGNEGGEIDLAFAQNTTLTGSIVVFDVYSDKVRIFEGGGNNRGVSIDLSKAPAGVGGELLWKASGLVNAGTFVSLDNIKASITTSGNRGLSLAAVSTTFTADISGYYGYTAGGSGASTYNASITTSTTTSIFNWGFNTQGDGSTYTVFDKTNNRVYRITIMINNSFNSNFISIERLY